MYRGLGQDGGDGGASFDFPVNGGSGGDGTPVVFSDPGTFAGGSGADAMTAPGGDLAPTGPISGPTSTPAPPAAATPASIAADIGNAVRGVGAGIASIFAAVGISAHPNVPALGPAGSYGCPATQCPVKQGAYILCMDCGSTTATAPGVSWDAVTSSPWLIPGLIVLGVVLLSSGKKRR